MRRIAINTDRAPQAIGPYSQAVRIDDTVYLSGQIPLSPETMELAAEDFETQCRQVFENLGAVAAAAGGTLDDVVKLTIYLCDLGNFPRVNEVMAQYFSEPYPARAAVGVSALPRAAAIEADAVLVLSSQ